jgi:hypothetical protein
MIYAVSKFKVGGRDFPYIVEFERENPETHSREGLTLRTSVNPKRALILKAVQVARLSLELHGLRLITDQAGSIMAPSKIGYAFTAVTWTYGDNPGSRVEIALTSQIASKKTLSSAHTKLLLPKVDTSGENELRGTGSDKVSVPVDGSLKNEYNAAVAQLRMMVEAYAEGESEQGELFNKAASE